MTADFVNFEILEGGSGNDVFRATESLTSVNGRDGSDRLEFLSFIRGIDLSDTFTIRNVEYIIGTNFDDVMTATGAINILQGADGNDRLTGKIGNEFLDGGFGDDTLSGRAGDDVLFGGFGNDQLVGGDGADRLRGDGNNDTLTGGSGADFFEFVAGPSSFFGADRILDFRIGQGDKIMLSGFGSLNQGPFQSDRFTTSLGYTIQADVLPVTDDRLLTIYAPSQTILGNIVIPQEIPGQVAPVTASWFLFL